jgi:hypothetical protein
MRRTLSLLTPLVLLFVSLLCVGIWVSLTFTTWKAHTLLAQQEQQVYDLVLKDLTSKLQRELDRNPDLQQSNRAQSILNHHFSQLAPIKRISVFDTQGTVLLDTNPVFVGTVVSEHWLTNSTNQNQRVWQDDSPGFRAVDATLRNRIGVPVAYLVVLTEALAERDTAFKLIFSIAWKTVWYVLLVVAAALGLAVWMRRRLTHQIQPVLQVLSHLAHPGERTIADPTLTPQPTPVAAFTTPVSACLQRIQAGQQQLQQAVDMP